MRLGLHRHRPRLFGVGEKKKPTDCKLDGGCTTAEELELDISSSSVMSSTMKDASHRSSSGGTHHHHLDHHPCVTEEEGHPEECDFMDDSDRSDMFKPTVMKPMMARLDALQMQQKIQGMNHPDVLFALKHLARAHRRRGELEQAKLVEEMLHAGHST